MEGIILANMERDALKREEFEMNKHGDVEVGSITAIYSSFRDHLCEISLTIIDYFLCK